jgi:hypothetical protein
MTSLLNFLAASFPTINHLDRCIIPTPPLSQAETNQLNGLQSINEIVSSSINLNGQSDRSLAYTPSHVSNHLPALNNVSNYAPHKTTCALPLPKHLSSTPYPHPHFPHWQAPLQLLPLSRLDPPHTSYPCRLTMEPLPPLQHQRIHTRHFLLLNPPSTQ